MLNMYIYCIYIYIYYYLFTVFIYTYYTYKSTCFLHLCTTFHVQETHLDVWSWSTFFGAGRSLKWKGSLTTSLGKTHDDSFRLVFWLTPTCRMFVWLRFVSWLSIYHGLSICHALWVDRSGMLWGQDWPVSRAFGNQAESLNGWITCAFVVNKPRMRWWQDVVVVVDDAVVPITRGSTTNNPICDTSRDIAVSSRLGSSGLHTPNKKNRKQFRKDSGWSVSCRVIFH